MSNLIERNMTTLLSDGVISHKLNAAEQTFNVNKYLYSIRANCDIDAEIHRDGLAY